MEPRAVISVDAVGHWFPGTGILFQGITASLAPGTVTGVWGPSGCGKSTLLFLLAGWERPRQGTIIREGVTSLAWVFQNPHGVARRSAVDHVAFPLLARGMNRGSATAEALRLMDRFQLADVAGQPFSALSGGEAQRLMLARALASSPSVLLVDEPTAQLDRQAAAMTNRNLAQLASGGAIVVVATHDPQTRAVCDQIIDLSVASTAAPRGGASHPPATTGGLSQSCPDTVGNTVGSGA